MSKINLETSSQALSPIRKKWLTVVLLFLAFAFLIPCLVIGGIIHIGFPFAKDGSDEGLPVILLVTVKSLIILFAVFADVCIVYVFNKIRKDVTLDKTIFFKGIVTNKEKVRGAGTRNRSNASFGVNDTMNSGGFSYVYSFELSNEKQFKNVQVQFYNLIEIGNYVEVEVTVSSGEILDMFVPRQVTAPM